MRDVTVGVSAEKLPNGCEPHGIPAYRDAAGTVHIATGGRCVGPDAARDARVAERRAFDARQAGRALDALMARRMVVDASSYKTGWQDGYAASEEHHKRDYGAPDLCRAGALHGPHPHNGERCIDCPACVPPCPRPAAHMESEYRS